MQYNIMLLCVMMLKRMNGVFKDLLGWSSDVCSSIIKKWAEEEQRGVFMLTRMFVLGGVLLGLTCCRAGSAVNNSIAPTQPACTVAGKNVFVPSNASCTYNSNTATCTNGVLDYIGITSTTGVIITNGVTLSCL